MFLILIHIKMNKNSRLFILLQYLQKRLLLLFAFASFIESLHSTEIFYFHYTPLKSFRHFIQNKATQWEKKNF